jgi:predicted nucleic acid-binding protein
MFLYPDTSVLVSLFLKDGRAEAVEDAIINSGSTIILSRWTILEIVAGLARAVRQTPGQVPGYPGGFQDQDFARALTAVFDFISEINIGAPIVDILPEAINSAIGFLSVDPTLELRAGDALHIGIMSRLDNAMLLTADKRLHGAAQRLNIQSNLIL